MDYKYLKNPRNLKAFFKEASSSEISSILEKLAALRDEVKAEETAKELAEKQRQEFLSGLLNDLDNHNFTIEDLATLKGIQTKLNRPKMKARYEYEGIDALTLLLRSFIVVRINVISIKLFALFL